MFYMSHYNLTSYTQSLYYIYFSNIQAKYKLKECCLFYHTYMYMMTYYVY